MNTIELTDDQVHTMYNVLKHADSLDLDDGFKVPIEELREKVIHLCIKIDAKHIKW